MPDATNKDRLLQFQQALETKLHGGSNTLGDFLHPDISWHFPQSAADAASASVHRGKAAVLAMFGDEVALFYQPQTMKFDYHAFTAEDERVHMHYTLSAKTANGIDYRNDYQSLFVFEGGLILEVWEYFDTAYLYGLFAAE